MQISELTKMRWRNFKNIKRAYYSLIVLTLLFVISLGNELLINNKPLILGYEGSLYFPIVNFYSDETFGGAFRTEANYPKLDTTQSFIQKGWMLFPIIPFDPLTPHLDIEGIPPHAPSTEHWLGTDENGRDVLARLAYGFRNCILFALGVSLFSTVMGILIGAIQGYRGGWFDIVGQRFIEIWSSLPFLYIVILIGAIYGRSFILLLVLMSIFSWVSLSYYMRGEFLKLKNMTYVKMARASGLPTRHILFKEILPNALTPVITILPFSIIGGIAGLTSLDFLGFGLQPPTPSWGELMQQGLNNLNAPWIALSTLTALFGTLLLTTFVGEGVREAFDPKAEAR
ncbi:MAG: ABC transporter permease [Fibrobacterales bacterium]